MKRYELNGSEHTFDLICTEALVKYFQDYKRELSDCVSLRPNMVALFADLYDYISDHTNHVHCLDLFTQEDPRTEDEINNCKI